MEQEDRRNTLAELIDNVKKSLELEKELDKELEENKTR